MKKGVSSKTLHSVIIETVTGLNDEDDHSSFNDYILSFNCLSLIITLMSSELPLLSLFSRNPATGP